MHGDHLSGPVYRGQRRGFMLVLSSPSGAGKTTLSKRLLTMNPDLVLSVSATTRDPRPGEKHGEDYYFMEQDEFVAKTKTNEFYEWAKVFDNYYGTPKGPVEEALDEGRDVVFDIDWQGAQALAHPRVQRWPRARRMTWCVSSFCLPRSSFCATVCTSAPRTVTRSSRAG